MAIARLLRGASDAEGSGSSVLGLEISDVGIRGDSLVLLGGWGWNISLAGLEKRSVRWSRLWAAYLLLHVHARTHSLDAVAALDNVCLEGNGPRPAVQLEEQAAGIAEDGAGLVATPQRSGGRLTILADGLRRLLVVVSRHGGHHGWEQCSSALQETKSRRDGTE